MTSNFLGDPSSSSHVSGIISANELAAREGINLQKGMNYRDEKTALSVFLVLPRADGFKDAWNATTQMYTFEGHDSVTVENGKATDQLAMYESGKLSDNGKFFKAAAGFKDGARRDPLQVQVYEKLDPGVWFDKGIFDLIDAERVVEAGRKVFKFKLTPADAWDTSEDRSERMISASEKETAWKKGRGRCIECGFESGLHFVRVFDDLVLKCNLHAGGIKRGLL